MDIREAKAHLLAASGKGESASVHNWIVARWIYEQVQQGAVQADIATGLAVSETKVSFYKKAWRVCVVDPGLADTLPDDPEEWDLPDFAVVFHSPEVRGPSAGPGGSGERHRPKQATGRTATDREPAENIHDYVGYVKVYAHAIATASPADKAELSPAERGQLARVVRDLSAITAKSASAA